MKKINFSPLICFLFIIVLFASCMRRKDIRLHGCMYNITTDEVIQRQHELTLHEERTINVVPIGQYFNFETNGMGCYDEVIELGKAADYKLNAHVLDEETFGNIAEYDYFLSKINYYDLDVSKLPNNKKLEFYGDAEFKIDRDEFKRKNRDVEINFGFFVFGKFRISLINSSGADSITVYAKNPFFEDIIFSNSGLGNKSSKEYRLTSCQYTLRYEVIKNGVVTTTTEEILIKEDELINITHNY